MFLKSKLETIGLKTSKECTVELLTSLTKRKKLSTSLLDILGIDIIIIRLLGWIDSWIVVGF